MSAPPPAVLEAFGVTGEPTLLRGGMGRTWRVGDVVLKPVADVVEHAWVAEVYDAWSDPSLLVPHPLRADGAWSFDGWGAHVLVPGRNARASDDPAWFHRVAETFHAAVAHLPRPAFLDHRDDPWSFGDRVAWDGVAPPRGARDGDPRRTGHHAPGAGRPAGAGDPRRPRWQRAPRR